MTQKGKILIAVDKGTKNGLEIFIYWSIEAVKIDKGGTLIIIIKLLFHLWNLDLNLNPPPLENVSWYLLKLTFANCKSRDLKEYFQDILCSIHQAVFTHLELS